MNFISKITTFLKEVRLEIKKVNWPTRSQTFKYTMVVLGVSAGVAAFLGSLDYIFKILITKFIL